MKRVVLKILPPSYFGFWKLREMKRRVRQKSKYNQCQILQKISGSQCYNSLKNIIILKKVSYSTKRGGGGTLVCMKTKAHWRVVFHYTCTLSSPFFPFTSTFSLLSVLLLPIHTLPTSLQPNGVPSISAQDSMLLLLLHSL